MLLTVSNFCSNLHYNLIVLCPQFVGRERKWNVDLTTNISPQYILNQHNYSYVVRLRS